MVVVWINQDWHTDKVGEFVSDFSYFINIFAPIQITFNNSKRDPGRSSLRDVVTSVRTTQQSSHGVWTLLRHSRCSRTTD